MLRQLIQAALGRKPELAALHIALETTISGGTMEYRSPDPYEACLVGAGLRSTFIDRADLRSGLKGMIDAEWPVLSVTGASLSGKSHSVDFIKDVASQFGYRVVVVSIERHFTGGVTWQAFAKNLALRLGLAIDLEQIDVYTTGMSIALQFVSVLVGAFDEDDEMRLLVIDGLDRPEVPPEVRDLVRALADEISQRSLGHTQLVVTGHDAPFSAEVEAELITERIGEINASHVRLFFERIFAHLGGPVDDSVVADLVSQVVDTVPLADRKQLGRRAREVACEHWAELR